MFYNPIIRATFLSSIKANMTAFLVFKMSSNDRAQLIAAVIIFISINCAPLVYAIILCKHKDRLQDEKVVRKYGTLYDNKNVSANKNHKVWTVPLSFFYRRTVFTCLTVYLFEKPSMQMIIH